MIDSENPDDTSSELLLNISQFLALFYVYYLPLCVAQAFFFASFIIPAQFFLTPIRQIDIQSYDKLIK